MPVEERQRRLMVESLVRVHGEEVADAIMAHLPPLGWDQMATKQDLAALKQDVAVELAAVRVELHQGLAGVQKEITRQTIGVVLAVLLAVLGSIPLNAAVN